MTRRPNVRWKRVTAYAAIGLLCGVTAIVALWRHEIWGAVEMAVFATWMAVTCWAEIMP